jgi:hypothetical protein
MTKTVPLVCALGTPQAECSMDTAAAVIQGPDTTSLVRCGLHGQAYIAPGAIAGYLDGAHDLKITCTWGQPVRTPALAPIRSAEHAPGTAPTID